MIVPNKYLSEYDALIGVGAVLLKHLFVEKTLTGLWDEVKEFSNIGSFERFILGLDLLFVLGLVEIQEDKLLKVGS